jgi:hypothetical protein
MKYLVCALVSAVVLSAAVGIRASESGAQSGPTADTTVYVTKTGAKYHQDGCRSLSQSKIPMKLGEAAKRYEPCSICKPPVLQSASPAARPAPAKDSADPIVYVTKTGSKYHKAGCRSLSKSAIPMKLSEARGKYGPCSVCKPPTVATPAPSVPLSSHAQLRLAG